ncbi:transcriptional regulator containing GAF, AAA-type ATPase, and DNA binding domains [Opitutaceae bacterium TAV1]|nr:Fis family transcriptional regulator [Opitutaceae bacterium TAV5]EIP96951.1 transcriptional regulator containing GAF, AAA-type ATPase, and DNA binding domains [Opitutaceae bacterium TAV1]
MPPDTTGGRALQPPSCRLVGELDLLHEIVEALGEGGELHEATRRMFAKLADTKHLRRGLLTILNRETGNLLIEALDPEAGPGAAKQAPRSPAPAPCRVGEGIIGRALADGGARCIPDLHTLPPGDFSPWEKTWFGDLSGPAALLIVPIRHGEEVLGALSFIRPPAPPAIIETDLRFLALVAGQVGLAVRFRQITQERLDTLRQENERLQEQIKRSFIPEGMIGKSSAMRMVYFHVDQVADSKTTVLIRGETGVGKERVAQAIWQGGSRKNRPFVRVNCAALPESIIESELFGHEKGAFTGALALRKGRFELAHTGTLFLDEIGEISMATQAKLLRVLQEGVFERVGGAQPIKVDVRVITATNRNLEEMIEQGKFRLDLYYRINVFPIYVPPLRERRSDLLELSDHFLEKYSRQNGKRVVRISTPAIDMLMAYHWPGNVRELENIIERAVLLAQDGVIHGYHLPPTLQTAESSGTASPQTLQETLDAVEREMIVEALKSSRGVMARAARQLGITERTMGLRVKTLAIEPRRFREDPDLSAS